MTILSEANLPTHMSHKVIMPKVSIEPVSEHRTHLSPLFFLYFFAKKFFF